MTRPVRFHFEGGAMHPAGPHQARIAASEYEDGKQYVLVQMEDRSIASHNHQFAWLHEAWMNLPDQYRMEPWAQSVEGLRKYALIRTKHCDVQHIACGSNAAAQRVALLARDLDPYSLSMIEGSTVHVMRAHSQSMKAMGKAAFEQSKRDILEFIAGLLGVDPDTLGKQERAA